MGRANARDRTGRAHPFDRHRRVGLKKKDGVQFVAVIVDHTNRRVLDILENRQKTTVKAYLAAGRQSGLLGELEEVTTDMWDAYVTAAGEVFGAAVRVTIDRFHVMKNFNDQLENARRKIQRALAPAERSALKGTRWLWLKNPVNLTAEERSTLKKLCRQFPKLGRLYHQGQRLRAIFDDESLVTAAAGRRRLQQWIKQSRELGLRAAETFCRTLENWLDGISNYFVDRSSNGPTEGYNNGLRSILRRAFGLVNFEHFRARALDLFRTPQPQPSP